MEPGVLTLVATPIGNLGDISARAAGVLAAATVVACEDTRRTGRLLSHLGVDRRSGVPRLLVLNDAGEESATAEVLTLLARGESVALVTDAGTPALADPGTRLVAAAAAAGCRVTIVPGPSAPAAALAVSGLAALPHVFEGWLPRAGAARRDRIARIAAEPRTVVLLESPRRVAATLAELAEACGGDRRCAVVRELTKLHEEVVRATLAAAAAHFGGDDAPKGEFVVVIGPRPPTVPTDADITTALAAEQAAGATRRAAVDAVAASLDVARNRVYGLALAVPRPSD